MHKSTHTHFFIAKIHIKFHIHTINQQLISNSIAIKQSKYWNYPPIKTQNNGKNGIKQDTIYITTH